IAIDNATESPLLAQNLLEDKRIGRCRNSIKRIKCTHDARRTGIDRATKGRQIVLPQSVLRYLRAVVVASSLGGSVSHIVLGAGGDAVGSTKPRTLIAPDVGGGHCRTQVGVFSCAFGDAAPPRVSGGIRDGCKRRAHALGRDFWVV